MKLLRFQFRLRTLFVIMTLFAIGLGCFTAETKRYAALRRNWISAHGHTLFVTEDQRVLAYADKSRSPGRLRIWLGDESYDMIVLNQAPSAATKQQAVDLFPEADIFAPRAAVKRPAPVPRGVAPTPASTAY